MIQGSNKSEAGYREVYLDSSSSLKDFSLDRKKYYRKYILNEEVEDKDTQASTMGRVVETLLMQPELFDDKFYMSACVSAPTGKMLEFVEALYDITKACTDEEGNITRDFIEMSKEAYIKAGYKITFERVMGDFIGKDAEIYYNEIRVVRSKGLTVVTPTDVTIAENIVETLKTNFVTQDLVALITGGKWRVFNQLQVEGFTINQHTLKAMMDKVIINDEEKTVQVYDLKCVWAVENFYEEYYLYRRAYIQAFVYYKACLHLVDTDPSLKDYKVLLPKFIVCDSTNYFNPLIYTLREKDMTDAYDGFEYKGRNYPGVSDIIQDLQWALDFNIWNISRNNYSTNGVVTLKP